MRCGGVYITQHFTTLQFTEQTLEPVSYRLDEVYRVSTSVLIKSSRCELCVAPRVVTA